MLSEPETSPSAPEVDRRCIGAGSASTDGDMLAAADTAADAATDAEAETVAGGNVGDAGFSDGD